ncbi:hypothetical protein ABK040_000801 [Willaertia magna]
MEEDQNDLQLNEEEEVEERLEEEEEEKKPRTARKSRKKASSSTTKRRRVPLAVKKDDSLLVSDDDEEKEASEQNEEEEEEKTKKKRKTSSKTSKTKRSSSTKKKKKDETDEEEDNNDDNKEEEEEKTELTNKKQKEENVQKEEELVPVIDFSNIDIDQCISEFDELDNEILKLEEQRQERLFLLKNHPKTKSYYSTIQRKEFTKEMKSRKFRMLPAELIGNIFSFIFTNQTLELNFVMKLANLSCNIRKAIFEFTPFILGLLNPIKVFKKKVSCPEFSSLIGIELCGHKKNIEIVDYLFSKFNNLNTLIIRDDKIAATNNSTDSYFGSNYKSNISGKAINNIKTIIYFAPIKSTNSRKRSYDDDIWQEFKQLEKFMYCGKGSLSIPTHFSSTNLKHIAFVLDHTHNLGYRDIFSTVFNDKDNKIEHVTLCVPRYRYNKATYQVNEESIMSRYYYSNDSNVDNYKHLKTVRTIMFDTRTKVIEPRAQTTIHQTIYSFVPNEKEELEKKDDDNNNNNPYQHYFRSISSKQPGTLKKVRDTEFTMSPEDVLEKVRHEFMFEYEENEDKEPSDKFWRNYEKYPIKFTN